MEQEPLPSFVDLSDPEKLRATIESVFSDELERSLGMSMPLDPDVTLALIGPGMNWDPAELREVNQDRLNEAIRSVVSQLETRGFTDQPLTVAEVSRALKQSSCHYLWFC